MPIRVVDLFCGAGGLTTGLVNAGLEVVIGIDSWNKAIDTYGANHKHEALCADLRQVDPVSLDLGRVDVVVGGPPCQGFSNAGKRDKKDPRNSLFMEFVRFVAVLRPKLFLMENVPGILSMKSEDGHLVKDIILAEFDRIGYTVEIQKLLAADFEVPQNRRRVFFLGKPKESQVILSFPKPVLELKDHLPVGPLLVTQQEAPPSTFLSQKAIDGINRRKEQMKTKGFGFGAQFLDPMKPSYTISARNYRDGYDSLVVYPTDGRRDVTLGNVRRLLPEEVALIQSFPSDYKFIGSRKDVFIQLGNAVPCKLAEHLGGHIRKLLGDDMF